MYSSIKIYMKYSPYFKLDTAAECFKLHTNTSVQYWVGVLSFSQTFFFTISNILSLLTSVWDTFTLLLIGWNNSAIHPASSMCIVYVRRLGRVRSAVGRGGVGGGGAVLAVVHVHARLQLRRGRLRLLVVVDVLCHLPYLVK